MLFYFLIYARCSQFVDHYPKLSHMLPPYGGPGYQGRYRAGESRLFFYGVFMMIEVFFDGKCGLCSKEIAYYQRIAPSGIFVWMDIATDASPLAAHQISQADALRYLHVRDEAGNWHIGAAAFLVIWQQLRYWRFLALLVGLPIFRQIAAMVYNRFADYRFTKLAHCQIAKKNLA